MIEKLLEQIEPELPQYLRNNKKIIQLNQRINQKELLFNVTYSIIKIRNNKVLRARR